MFELSLQHFATLILGFSLLLILALWMFLERKHAATYLKMSKKVVYHCVKCHTTYTKEEGDELEPCPSCSFNNARLKF